MKKITTAVLMLLIFYLNSNGQITEGNWLVGGTGRFSSQLLDINDSEV